MRFLLVSFLIIILLTPAIIYGQAKVGTSGAGFLKLSPSLRANGMGEAGVALADPHSVFFNPAALGMYASQQRISLTPPFWSTEMPGGINNKFSQMVAGFNARQLGIDLPLSFGVGWYRVKLEAPEIEETNHSRPPTGRVFEWGDKSENFTLAVAYDGPLRVALGGTYKLIDQGAHDSLRVEGHAFDYGVQVQIPVDKLLDMSLNETISIVFRPSIGAVWRNEGPDLKYRDNSSPLANSRRWGIAFELGAKWKTPHWNWRLLVITPAIDEEKTWLDDRLTSQGIELELAEAVALRIGDSEGRDINKTTWGFTVSSTGLVKILLALTAGTSTPPSRTSQFLIDRLAVEYTEARYSYDSFFPDRKFSGLTVSYRHTVGD